MADNKHCVYESLEKEGGGGGDGCKETPALTTLCVSAGGETPHFNASTKMGAARMILPLSNLETTALPGATVQQVTMYYVI